MTQRLAWSALTRPSTRRPTPTNGEITVEDLQSRIYRFSADSMQGRLMGTPGNAKGAEYIAAELKRMGLEPAGEKGTYFQLLPWMDRALDESTTITAGGRAFRAWTDFVPRDQGPGERTIDGVPVVYAGDFANAGIRPIRMQQASRSSRATRCRRRPSQVIDSRRHS